LASDRQFSVNFWFHEFKGWETATPAQRDKAEELARFVLQPIRRKFGRLIITSWLRPGSKNHGDGDAVDFVAWDEIERQLESIPAERRAQAPDTARKQAEEAAHLVVKDWAATYIVPSRVIGELIAERNHVHITRWGVGGHGEVLEEPVEGTYSPGAALGPAVWLLLALAIVSLAIIALYGG
jgi:hypothetical protein